MTAAEHGIEPFEVRSYAELIERMDEWEAFAKHIAAVGGTWGKRRLEDGGIVFVRVDPLADEQSEIFAPWRNLKKDTP